MVIEFDILLNNVWIRKNKIIDVYLTIQIELESNSNKVRIW